jgi:SAM-dependent methyltransferase
LTLRDDRDVKAITLGHPSYVWRFGQDRRLAMIGHYAPLQGRRILDAGCGVGMYVRAFRQFSDDVYGIDVDADKIVEASRELPHLQVAPAESLPFEDDFFDVVLSHETLEHVQDDRAAVREAVRVLKPGGRLVVFCPNRLWLFETHGVYWRGVYHFGNIPLVNWLPDALRNRLAPHVRAYTVKQLGGLFRGLPVSVVVHTQIYPGYDNVLKRRPALGRVLRALTYAAERTPLRLFGLSHLLVVEKTGEPRT